MIAPVKDKMWCYACQRRKGAHLFSHKHKMNRTEAIEQAARELLIEINAIGVAPPQELSALEKALAMPEADADGCAVCGEVYQVVGALWNGQSNLVPVLDNLSASATGQPIPHDTLLPFVPKADAERVALLANVELWLEQLGKPDCGNTLLLERIRAYLGGDE